VNYFSKLSILKIKPHYKNSIPYTQVSHFDPFLVPPESHKPEALGDYWYTICESCQDGGIEAKFGCFGCVFKWLMI